MPWLAKTPATVRFLSLEPLLGPITLPDPDSVINMAMQEGDNPIFTAEPIDYIDWVIIGGESGPNARPMNLGWVEDILTQCLKANIPAFVKQLGAAWAGANDATHSKGGDPDEWPPFLRVRMFPGEAWE
jgi:protein gp37